MMQKLSWRTSQAPVEIHALLRNLAEDYPIAENKKGLALQFEKIEACGTLRVLRRAHEVLIQYSAPGLAARALGCLWAGAAPNGKIYEEKTPFRTLGMMLDCSRNSVITVGYFKKWLRRCALLGYNQAMLYTEDTYEMPEEPYFGYMRGAYTEAELRELDRYAAELGIEMVACIQTLGHLEHALRWPAYAKVRDTRGTLLVDGEKATYALIAKMLDHWSQVFRSRRIVIGMDEAVDIGKGRGSDRCLPPKPAGELFFKHLNKVAGLCARRGLRPIVWSDMIFWALTPERGLEEAYYDARLRHRAELKKRLPKNVQLAYWDYSPEQPEPYRRRIAKHRALGFDPIVASGCHIWGHLWHEARSLTMPRVAACVRACRASKARELLMTLWTGIAGVDLDSAWAGLAFAAEQAFHESPSPQLLQRRYRAVCRADYRASLAGALAIWRISPAVGAPSLLWDDPLLGMFLRSLHARDGRLLARIASHYHRLALRLRRWRGSNEAGDIDHARLLAGFLAHKADLSLRLQRAYRRKSIAALRTVRAEIPAQRRRLGQLQESFRRVWLRQCKPFGLEVLQIRLAGQAQRYTELERRIGELLQGAVADIAELETKPLPFNRHKFSELASASMLL